MEEYLINVHISFIGSETITITNLTPEQAGDVVQWFKRQTHDLFEFTSDNEVLILDRNQATYMKLAKVGE